MYSPKKSGFHGGEKRSRVIQKLPKDMVATFEEAIMKSDQRYRAMTDITAQLYVLF